MTTPCGRRARAERQPAERWGLDGTERLVVWPGGKGPGTSPATTRNEFRSQTRVLKVLAPEARFMIVDRLGHGEGSAGVSPRRRPSLDLLRDALPFVRDAGPEGVPMNGIFSCGNGSMVRRGHHEGAKIRR